MLKKEMKKKHQKVKIQGEERGNRKIKQSGHSQKHHMFSMHEAMSF